MAEAFTIECHFWSSAEQDFWQHFHLNYDVGQTGAGVDFRETQPIRKSWLVWFVKC